MSVTLEKIPTDGIQKVLALRYNCWIIFGSLDIEPAISETRDNLREEIQKRYPFLDLAFIEDLKPIEVKPIEASFGYPDRVLVAW